MKNILLITLTVFALSACNKEDTLQPEQNRLEGFWLLTEITGGIAGTGYEVNFDHLQMTNHNRYALMAYDSFVQEGDYDLTIENDQLIIHFIPDMADTIIFHDVEKTVLFSEQDRKLVLSDPCCDSFVYPFEREGE